MRTGSTDTEKIPDHVRQAQADLRTVWKRTVFIRGAVRASARGIQRWENIAYAYLVSSRFSVAEGFLLDLWGEWLDTPRLGLGHSDYRRVLAARILADTCDDSPEKIAGVFAAVTAPSVVRYYDAGPWNGYYLVAYREHRLSDAMVRRVVDIMESVRPVMRTADLRETVGPGYFAFAGAPDPADLSPEGWGTGRPSRRLV